MKLEQALVEYGLKPTSLVDRLQAAQDQPLVNTRAPRLDNVTTTTDTATITWAGGTITMGDNGQWHFSDTRPVPSWANDPNSGYYRSPPPTPPLMLTPRERVAFERADRLRHLRARNQGRRSR